MGLMNLAKVFDGFDECISTRDVKIKVLDEPTAATNEVVMGREVSIVAETLVPRIERFEESELHKKRQGSVNGIA